MGWLKADTATILKLGAFVDDTDFKTAETGLTIGQADIQISKNGGAFAQTSDSSPTTTHDADGWYPIPLTTTDTNTEGSIVVQVTVSGALPVWWHGTVVAASTYDALVLGTDTLTADVTQIGGVAQSATDLKDFADTGYDPSTHKVAGVVLTDTATAITNDVTTDTASRTASKADVSALALEATVAALNDFDPSNDTVANVTTVGTVTNDVTTDTASRTASKADVSALALEATVAALNDFDPANDTVANVTTVGTVTNDVTTDTASRTASKADVSALALEATVAALNDISSADVNAACDTAISDAGLTAEGIATQVDTTLTASHGEGDWITGGAGSAPTVEEIDAELTANHGAGSWTGAALSGTVEFTYTLTRSDTGAAIADASLEFYTESAMTNLVATATTDAFGQATVYLAAGTYYIRRVKSGYTFTNPDTEIIA